ncbi:MAG: N-acetylglucosamine-6-phosphate deacetylase [Actinobacteria bacterium]|nr:N-acetylglucosamine-6-phosphate deacetylase [Actinomycetota bacterium]
MRVGAARSLLDGRLRRCDLVVADGRVVDTAPPAAGELLAVPGLVDLQVNGFAGVDLLTADVDGYREVGAALLGTGVTAYLPTFISCAPEVATAALATLTEARRSAAGPELPGAHLEGPFLSARRAGTHPVDALRAPDLELARRLLAAGPVSLMTLAPELPGALDLIRQLRAAGVAVSLGHSDATGAEARLGFGAGAAAVTHLFNGMRPLHHREPALAGAALSDPGVLLGVIADGVHVAPELLGVVGRAAPGRVLAVTDAIAAAGAPDGDYRLGDVPVRVRDRVARRDDGVLAGSTLTMPAAIRALRDAGLPLLAALAAATSTPARLLGRPDLGVLRVGGRADVVLLDPDLTVRRTLLAGRPHPGAHR